MSQTAEETVRTEAVPDSPEGVRTVNIYTHNKDNERYMAILHKNKMPPQIVQTAKKYLLWYKINTKQQTDFRYL